MQLLVRKPDVGYLDANLWVPKGAIQADGVKSALQFTFFEQQNPVLLTLWKETADHLIVPREFWDPKHFSFPVVDCRPRRYERTDLRSRILLDHVKEDGKLVPTGNTVQQEAMNALMRTRGGVLQLACGKGKTVVALEYIVRRGFPAIIILDTSQLMEQWQKEIALHLDVPGGVGLIRGSTFDWKKSIVLATYHSLADRALSMPEEVRRWFGTAVWDEAHHVAAPKFSRTADLFYGVRLGLTATPDREDGMHVVYNFHLGPVIFKNLTQELVPRIYFSWTGLGLDGNDPRVQAATRDVNGELHIGKVAAFLGSWKPRVDFVVNQIRMAVAQNRKVIVLSKSVDALINLLAAWNNRPDRISDIPFPDAADVGETVPPAELEKRQQNDLFKQLNMVKTKIAQLTKPTDNVRLQHELQKKANIEQRLDAHKVYKKCELLWNKTRSTYLKELLAQPSTAGLMIYKVKAAERTAMLRSKQVTFAIAKYGKEGLDEPNLDTILVNEPISSRNGLQQLMGRVLRRRKGKQEPVVVFFEDDIGPFIGMCKKLRQHLTEWPRDEGGPFEYEVIGHPTNSRKSKPSWKTDSSKTFNPRTSIQAPGSSRP